MFIHRLGQERDAATSIDYALIATIISIASIAAFRAVGLGVVETFDKIGTALSLA